MACTYNTRTKVEAGGSSLSVRQPGLHKALPSKQNKKQRKEINGRDAWREASFWHLICMQLSCALMWVYRDELSQVCHCHPDQAGTSSESCLDFRDVFRATQCPDSAYCFLLDRALSEKIVSVLPRMKCPHQLEPHQIQGMDFIHIFPVVQVRPSV